MIVLDRGRLVASGTIDELRGRGSGSLESVFLDVTGR